MAKTAGKPPAKSEVVAKISESTGLTKKQVSEVLDSLSDQIRRSLGKGGSKVFTIPGLCKITVVHKPAEKAKEGINPFTKEPIMIKAKPARNVIKVRALKQLKEMAN